MKKNTVWIPIILFLALIFGGMLWGVLKEDRPYSDTENRYLARRPVFSWDRLFDGSYTQDYEEYVTDQLPLRDSLVGLKTRVEAALGKTETKGVWLAAKDYLIVNHPAEDFEGEQAQKNSLALAEAVAYYAGELGDGHVRVLLVPTASQILAANLPPDSPRYDQSQYLKRVRTDAARRLAGADGASASKEAETDRVWELFPDVEEALAAHAEEYIFYRTDHHWTTLGAFYAYQAWAKSLGLAPLSDPSLRVVSEDFLGTTWSKLHALGQADTISVYDSEKKVALTHNRQTQSEGCYDWAALEKRDQYAVFLGGNDGLLEIRPTEEGGGEKRVLLVVKDSFANCFLPYAAEHFDTILVVDLRYLNMSLKALASQYEVTDLLVLYNVQAFATDATVLRIAK